ncbi:hypothetical protein EYF80_032131 [Liparis tanakae]|uniref:Uncharacterized protein n=1 Tax=Liparis tanakae TaxID=230148 RepID=A0A4Z2GW33_9TELE|nr:hypothetical protein EYF80_032131 [Liparis tanakae]
MEGRKGEKDKGDSFYSKCSLQDVVAQSLASVSRSFPLSCAPKPKPLSQESGHGSPCVEAERVRLKAAHLYYAAVMVNTEIVQNRCSRGSD